MILLLIGSSHVALDALCAASLQNFRFFSSLLGYDGVDHQLIVNRPEAETVREIFRQYLRLGCVKELKIIWDGNR